MDPVVLLLSAIITGALGSQVGALRGRPLAGVGWGFLLGPLGWIVVLLGPDLRPRCNACAGVIMPDARRCKNCGSKLSTADTAPVLLPTPSLPDDRSFDLVLEGASDHSRAVLLLNCPSCGEETRFPVSLETEGPNPFTCTCGFTLVLSHTDLADELLRLADRRALSPHDRRD